MLDQPPSPPAPTAKPPNSALTMPWDLAAPLPGSLLGAPYGYLEKNRAIPCTQEELRARVGALTQPECALLWTPDQPCLVLPMEVPWLLEENRARRRQRLLGALRSAGRNLLLLGGLAVLLVWENQGSITQLLVLLALVFAVLPGLQALWGLRRIPRLGLEELREDARYIRYASWIRQRPSPASRILCGVLIILFAIQWQIGPQNALFVAALIKPAVWHGEWWRLLSGTLLHLNLIHLAFNGIFLIQVGRELEGLTHPLQLPVVFLAAAIGGSLASLVLLPEATSVGASGGLLGLLGFLTVLGMRQGRTLPRAVQRGNLGTLLLIAGLGLAAHEMIDNAGHLGGALTGALVGLIALGRTPQALPRPLGRINRMAGICSALLLLGFSAWMAWKMIETSR